MKPKHLPRLLAGAAALMSLVPAGSRAQGGPGDLVSALQGAAIYRETRPSPLITAQVPSVGCHVDGPAGFVPAPTPAPTTRVLVPQGSEPALAYYTSSPSGGGGVLGPRGWSCRGVAGPDGATLYVVPPGTAGDPEDLGYEVAVVRHRFVAGGTAGRVEIARVAGDLFPDAERFAERVRAEEGAALDEAGDDPFPIDRIDRLSRNAVLFSDLPSGPDAARDDPGGRPASGRAGIVVFGRDGTGDPSLLRLDVRLGTGEQGLRAAILAAFASELRLAETSARPELPARPESPAAREVPDRPDDEPSRGSVTAVVRGFYEALGRADGPAAAGFVTPGRRGSGPYAPAAMTRFHARLAEPLTLTGVRALGAETAEARYRYRTSAGKVCDGRVIVTVPPSAGGRFITRIRALNGC